MNSIVSVEGGIAPSGHRIGYFQSRMDNFAWCFGMDSAVRDPSIRQYCQLSGKLGLLLQLIVLDLGM